MQGENIPNSQNRTFTIVGCGNSAKDWQPNGYSIGVNDAWKFGKPTDGLLVCNRPQQFSQDRLKTITNSKPKHFYSNSGDWKHYFDYFDSPSRFKRIHSNNPELPMVKYMQWSGALYDNTVSFSNTSPITAISIAYILGAKEIILWGVDFRTHHLYNDNSPNTKRESEVYLEMFAALKEKGVSVYRGADGSVFDDKLPLYGKQVDLQMTGHFDNYMNG
jgi:hypothetical protein